LRRSRNSWRSWKAGDLEPTPENISHYIAFQREQLDRASSFADMWQRTICRT
jgi:hypothetical protein